MRTNVEELCSEFPLVGETGTSNSPWSGLTWGVNSLACGTEWTPIYKESSGAKRDKCRPGKSDWQVLQRNMGCGWDTSCTSRLPQAKRPQFSWFRLWIHLSFILFFQNKSGCLDKNLTRMHLILLLQKVNHWPTVYNLSVYLQSFSYLRCSQ